MKFGGTDTNFIHFAAYRDSINYSPAQFKFAAKVRFYGYYFSSAVLPLLKGLPLGNREADEFFIFVKIYERGRVETRPTAFLRR